MCAKTHVHLAQQRLPSEISHRISFKLDVNSFLPLPSLYSNILETWLLVWNINKVKSLHHFYFLCFVLSCCYLNKGVFFSECFLKTHFLPAEYELTLTCWPAIALLFVCLTSSSLLVFDYMMSLGAGGKTCHCSGSGNNQRRKCPHLVTDWLGRYLSLLQAMRLRLSLLKAFGQRQPHTCTVKDGRGDSAQQQRDM